MPEVLLMKTSPARKKFKESMGQVNHFLITILVGLDAVGTGHADISPDFSTSWNPKCKKASADRSRLFAIKATLAWSVAALETYFTLINRQPSLVQDRNLKRDLDAAGHSVHGKLKVFEQVVRDDLKLEWALVEMFILWRNRVVHPFAQSSLSASARTKLQESTPTIKNTYSGLDVDELLQRFSSSNPPRFKEITSLISAMHKFVLGLDTQLLQRLNYTEFVMQTLTDYLNESARAHRDKRLNNIWSKDDQTRIRTLKGVLLNRGFSVNENPEPNTTGMPVDDLLMQFGKKTLLEANSVF